MTTPLLATAQPPADSSPLSPSRNGGPPRRNVLLGLFKFALFLGVAGAAGFAAWRYPTEAANAWRSITASKKKSAAAAADSNPGTSRPWDGLLLVTPSAKAAMGIETVEASAQTEPIRLELLGTTEYISDTLTKVRPMFKGRVDRVYATVGQSIKKDDALVDFYSTELAHAKSIYEIEKIQWLYDKKLLEIRGALLRTNTVSQQLFDETKNSEMKTRREFEVSRDTLLVYGLTAADVEKVEQESGSQKARLTLRAPSDGLVISRDVAVGNLYDENDTLLVIAPLNRLWVWGNVFESDLDLVRLGQEWEIQFPFLKQKIRGKVEYISNRVDPLSHAIRIRTSIPNADGKLKSDMLVRGMLEISPVRGRVVIPRTALVVDNGHFHVFVESAKDPSIFERRGVSAAQEKGDRAIIAEGLKPGEKVVTVGGLILAQMYEDLQTTATGAPSPAGSSAD